MQELPSVWVGRVVKAPVQGRTWNQPITLPDIVGMQVEWFILKEPAGPAGSKKKGALYGNIIRAEERGSKAGNRRYMIGSIDLPSFEVLAVYEPDTYLPMHSKKSKDVFASTRFSHEHVRNIVNYAAIADRYKKFLIQERQNLILPPID